MQKALDLANDCRDEVPVSAIIVGDDQLIAYACNETIARNDPCAHAEILAIRQACQKFGNYRLPNCSLYVTLEPCAMCAGAIIHARLFEVIFAAFDHRVGAAGSVFQILGDARAFYHPKVYSGVLQHKSEQILQNFFRAKRHQSSFQ